MTLLRTLKTRPASLLLSLVLLTGCTVEDAGKQSGGEGQELTGTVMIDGSSTVFPISQAVAEEFQKVQPKIKVVVGTSGTGGGFDKFIKGETDINDASRPIKKSEIASCREKGIEFIELKVAIDGLSVMVNPANDWCDALTVAQLKSIWEPGSSIQKWSDLNSEWPDEPIKLYGPDTDSGTFDYFTEAVVGKGGASRSDYTPSTDDNVLVRGISGDKYSLGYFGYAYYIENKEKLKVLGIAPGDDLSAAVKPADDVIESGEYTPLSRPLFLYVSTASLKKPQVSAFLRYYLEQGQKLVGEVGYVKLSESVVTEAKAKLQDGISKATAASETSKKSEAE
ncbi:MAG: PstS family phosphate ABC transporter substrate-binding protein [Planctomycetaceae bacterium]|nr:PstS family phosphate ABC transporter substrate-binding protein [Planctomycetaceae bacterium]